MQLFNYQVIINSLPEILIKGVPIALKIGVVSFLVGILIGLIIALLRIYKVPVLSQLSAVYVSFFRGVPLVVQIMVFYYGIPIVFRYLNYRFGWGVNASGPPPMASMYIVYSTYIASYLSETIRAAIISVNRGQLEAGYSLGMSGPKVFWRVTIPQALVVAVPILGNTFISLIKDTSLAFVAGIPEVLGQAKIIAGRTSMFFEPNLAAALIYWVICIILEQLLRLIEKRARRHERRN